MVNSKKRGNSSKLIRVRGKAKSIKKRIKLRNRGKGRTKSTEVVYHSTKEIKVERALIENFIGLQKVMVNLSARFDSLSSQISKLLELFEISAKSLARKEFSSSEGLDSRKVVEKLDRLSAQAGLIGRGLALIHEVGTETGRPSIPILKGKQPMAPATQPTFSSLLMEPKPAEKMTQEIGPEKNTREMKKPGLGPSENVA